MTQLVIDRPKGFKFSPGDWVFVKIPSLASSEWHPFTISSAPEVKDHITLHIRGVGQWTNGLYSLFEKEYQRQKEGRDREVSVLDRIHGSIKIKYKGIRSSFKEKSKQDRKMVYDQNQINQQIFIRSTRGPYASMKKPKVIKYDNSDDANIQKIVINKSESEERNIQKKENFS